MLSILIHTVYPLPSYLTPTDVYQTLSAFVESYLMMHVNGKRHKKKLSRILFTNIVISDYDAFLLPSKLENYAGLIKQHSAFELLRFMILQILYLSCSNPIFHLIRQHLSYCPSRDHNRFILKSIEWRSSNLHQRYTTSNLENPK